MRKENAGWSVVAIVAGLLLLLGATASRAGTQDRGNAAAPAAAGITGTWEARGQPYEPWVFELRANGSAVTGRIWQNGGETGPVDISEGRIDGNTVTLKYLNAAGLRAITLSGVLSGSEITFTSQVQVQNNNVGGNGVFGAGIAQRFVVTRGNPSSPPTTARGAAQTAQAQVQAQRGVRGQATAAPTPTVPGGITVTGRILVDEGRPRPVFQIAFSDAKGEWISPPPPRGGRGTFDPAPNAGALLQANPPVFTIDLPPGEYRPIVGGLPAGYTVKSIQSDSTDLRSQPLKVAAGGNPPQLTVTLGVSAGPPWVKVRGRIVNVNSANAATELNRAQLSRPISIMLIGAAFSEYFVVPVAADGSFEFPWVLPGTYTVRLPPNIASSPASIIVGDKDLMNVEITAAP